MWSHSWPSLPEDQRCVPGWGCGWQRGVGNNPPVLANTLWLDCLSHDKTKAMCNWTWGSQSFERKCGLGFGFSISFSLKLFYLCFYLFIPCLGITAESNKCSACGVFFLFSLIFTQWEVGTVLGSSPAGNTPWAHPPCRDGFHLWGGQSLTFKPVVNGTKPWLQPTSQNWREAAAVFLPPEPQSPSRFLSSSSATPENTSLLWYAGKSKENWTGNLP